MGKKLYVGNLSYTATNADLEGLFAPFGAVRDVQVIQDRDTGRGKALPSWRWAATKRPRRRSPV